MPTKFRNPSAVRRAVADLSQHKSFARPELVLLDALRTVFGALDAFFREALDRAERRAREEIRAAAMRAREAPAAAAPSVSERCGVIADRPYVIHSDGAVTIETPFGVRRFSSMQEAREFIGA